VRRVSRNRTNFDNAYPQLIDALKSLNAKGATMDGEITALDDEGKSSFQLLQSYGQAKQTPLVYYAFDPLFLDGSNLRSRPLIERRKLLATLLKKASSNIRFSEELRGTKEELLQVAQKFELEGLVAKRRDSLYESGRRSGAWVKVKLTQQQEFVIGGYTPPEGSRKYFGALLVGYNSSAGLLFAGRVGTGFSEKLLADLYARLQDIRRGTCPFVNLPEKRRGRWGQGITPAVMKRCHWVEPVLVTQIKFTEWTLDDQLRQPVFLGLRTDKDPKDVVREYLCFICSPLRVGGLGRVGVDAETVKESHSTADFLSAKISRALWLVRFSGWIWIMAPTSRRRAASASSAL
jgi:bifunctional non-homologous end joining protein LigD